MNYKDKFKTPQVYEKSFVVYSYDEDLTIEDINKVLKDMNVSARELTDDEVIYQI
jgi:hypothetical protein|tara:strand:+ start:1676 stop:1840 length:165 start_codon:yes stop_codon:yes gene_type:complete